MKSLFVVLINFIISYVFTKLIIKPFKKLLPDIPNKRSSHEVTKPRGGGVTFFLSNYVTSLFIGQNSFLFLVPLSLISFFDDFKDISKILRFSTQLLTASFIFFSSNYFVFLKNNTSLFSQMLIIFLLIISSTALINFFNFMDGIDGLLSSSTLIFLITTIPFINGSVNGIIGSLAGFLVWNWSPSKIFMGDVGSNFLGGLVVWTLFNTNDMQHSICLLLVLLPLLLDPIICLIKRILLRKNIFKPHSMHLYQRLVKGGFSHGKVALLYAFATSSLSLSLLIGGLKLEIIATIITIIIGVKLNEKYAAKFI